MNNKITALAMLVSASSAFALIGPHTGPHRPQPVQKHYCLSLYEDQNGNTSVGSCDETARNEMYKLSLNQNGCADRQASLTTVNVEIKSCPTFVQL